MTPHLARPVSAYGNCAFDAFFFLASAWAEVGVMAEKSDFGNTLTRSEYFYGTGVPMQIDENANLATGGWYNFYTVVDELDEPIWKKVAYYGFGFLQQQMHPIEE